MKVESRQLDGVDVNGRQSVGELDEGIGDRDGDPFD